MSERLYRLLLRAWPREFRERHGGAMREAYADALAEARRRGRWRVVATHVAWWADAVRHGLTERAAARRPASPGRLHLSNGVGMDLRLAGRRLLREPGFALFVTVTLALGIGATASVFTYYNAAFLRTLPWPAGDRLVRLQMVDASGRARARVSEPDAEDVAGAAGVESVGVVDYGSVAIAGAGEAEVVRSAHASPSLFGVLGVRAARGRLFAADEAEPGRSDVVVLSDGLWRRRFGGDASVIGRTLDVQGRPRVIVGVLAPDFVAPDAALAGAPEVWLPLAVDGDLAARGSRWLQGIARTADGGTLSQVTTGMAAVAERLAADHPETNEGLSIRPLPLREALWGDVRTPMRLVLASAALVLLIACANLANLLLARGATRTRELALRSALGAGRARTVRMLVIEHGMLALLGGIGGLALVIAVRATARRLAAGRLPALMDAPLDARVFAFVLGLSALVAIALGIVPLVQLARRRPALLRSGRTVSGDRAAGAVRGVLVGAQIALCFVLLAGAALLVQSFRHAMSVDTGFDADRVLAWEVSLPAVRYPDAEDVVAYTDAVLERLKALPGVASAGVVDRLPLGSRYGCAAITFDGAPAPMRPDEGPCADMRAVSAAYLEAMGIRQLEGRPLDAAEPGGVLINRTLATQLWNDASPIGHTVAWADAADAPMHVVGVVDDVLHLGPGEPPLPEIYLPFRAAPDARMSFVVRAAAGDPASLAPAVRRIAAGVDAAVPLRSLRPMEDALREKLSAPRTGMLLVGGLAVVALFLAVVGLYGVQSYFVARRVPEIGIRMALGADRRRVMAMVLRGGMATASIATIIGAILALAAAQGLRAFLFGVDPADPMVFLSVAAMLLGISALACWAPARRAATVGPTEAMRAE